MKRMLVVSFGLLMLAACAPAPTATPIPTNTPIPTSSPTPTSAPTATPVSGTSTPTPIYKNSSSDNENFGWTYETEHFKVYYDSVDERLARATILAGEKIYPVLVRVFGKAPSTKTVVFIFQPGAKADKFFSLPPFFNPARFDGMFDTAAPLGESVRLFNPIGAQEPEGEEAMSLLKWLMAYTVGHRFYWHIYPNIRPPAGARWLEEGLVLYAALEASPSAPLALYGWFDALSRFSPSRPFVLDSIVLDKAQTSGQTAPLFYTRAVTAIHLIVRENGLEGLQRFFVEFDKSADFPNALQKALGLSLDNFQRTLNNSLADAKARSGGTEAGFYEAFTGKRMPTPVPTRTATPTPSPERYFKDIHLGKLPVGIAVSPQNVLTATAHFTPDDQLCVTGIMVADAQIAIGVYGIESQTYHVPRVAYPGTLKAGSTYLQCMPIIGLVLRPGMYETRLWVGDALIVALPFEVN